MASEANIAWLKEGGRRYVIGATRSDLRKFEQEFVERRDWRRIREDVEVKLCPSPDGRETNILCRSHARIEKGGAIVARAADRIRTRLESLERRLSAAKKPIDRDAV